MAYSSEAIACERYTALMRRIIRQEDIQKFPFAHNRLLLFQRLGEERTGASFPFPVLWSSFDLTACLSRR